jgi:hypothetical protein
MTEKTALCRSFCAALCGAVHRFGFPARLAVLTCAATLAVCGCGTKPTSSETINRYTDKLSTAVSTNVPDEGRRAQMLAIVNQLQALQIHFSQQTADFVQSYRKLNADHGAPRPAFDQLFSDYNAKRIKARNDALDLHFKLASLATATEWNSISKAEVKLYKESNEARSEEGGGK